MATPPNFGGREIEEGLEEDLGLPRQQDGPDHADPDLADLSENEAHAPGAICARCGVVIEAGQEVRRQADGRWVHEVCP